MNNKMIYLKKILNTYNSKINLKREKKLNKNIKIFLNIKDFSSYAYLIGKVMGDGHLSNVYNLKFIDGNKSNLEGLKKFIINNFKIKENRISIHSKKAKGRSFVLNINYALFGRVLYSLGAPKGNKTKQPFFVPQWIMSSNKYSKMFLKALLEDEISTIQIEKKNHCNSTQFKMAKEEIHLNSLRIFLEQVKDMIENCGVECSNISKIAKSKKGQKTKELYLSINRNKRNIIKFNKQIGFLLNTAKIRKLNECCNVLEKTLRPIINKEVVLDLRKQGLSIRKIAKDMNTSSSTIFRIVKI